MTEEIQLNQPDLPSTPPIVPEKKKSSWTIVKLLIVTLLVGAAGVYAGMQIQKGQLSLPFLKPIPTPAHVEPFPTVINPDRPTPPNETADWKTYTNDKFKYTFNYPSNYVLDSNSKNNSASVILTDGQQPLGFKIDFVWSGPIKSSETLLEYTKRLYSGKEGNVDKGPFIEVTKGTLTGYQSVQSKTIFTLVNENVFYINIYDFNDSKVTDQILSTFKFLE